MFAGPDIWGVLKEVLMKSQDSVPLMFIIMMMCDEVISRLNDADEDCEDDTDDKVETVRENNTSFIERYIHHIYWQIHALVALVFMFKQKPAVLQLHHL